MGYLNITIVILIVTFIVPKILEIYYGTHLPIVVDGETHPDFQKVQDVFRAYVSSGRIKGGSFAVFYKGRPIVDLWGGYADEQAEMPWQRNTLTIIHSSTKGLAAILIAKMVQRGWIDYDKPVSYYWPEFAQNGKENITVKILLTHQGGLCVINETLSMRMILEEPYKLEKILESQKPLWPPGTDFAYHALTFGLFVDRLIMKADPKNRTIPQIFRDEIAEPYGIDLTISAPRTENYRIARMTPMTLYDFIFGCCMSVSQMKIAYYFLKPNSMIMRSSSVLSEMLKPAVFNDPSIREIPLSSNMGFGNARAMAKLYGILANGGKMDGKLLLSRDLIKTLSTVHRSGPSKDLGIEMTMGKGVFFVNNTKGQPVFGHPGYGGQMAFADTHNNVGMAYVTNHLSIYAFGNDPNFIDLQNVFYECFDKFKANGN